MNMPIRIQRKRTRGWKMPENTISVTRPGEFGNPFVIGGFYKIGNGKDLSFCWIRCLHPTPTDTGYTEIKSAEQAVEMYKTYLSKYPLSESKISRLKGKNLACFCKEGEPCHADVLLQVANQ